MSEFSDLKLFIKPFVPVDIWLPSGELGEAKICKYYIGDVPRPCDMNILGMYLNDFWKVSTGWYSRLIIKGNTTMTDNIVEQRTNMEFVCRAHGHVLIGGLGLGLVLQPLVESFKCGRILSITIIEKSEDLINLVTPHFTDEMRQLIKVVHGDVFTPEALPHMVKYNIIYMDIWPGPSNEYLPEMLKLHMLWKPYLNELDLNAWINSWMYDWLMWRKTEDVVVRPMYQEWK